MAPRFEPFFADPEAITREVGLFSAQSIVRLDQDRVLVLTGVDVVLLDRSGPVAARRILSAPQFSGKVLKTAASRPVARGVPVPLLLVAQGLRADTQGWMFALDLLYDGSDQITLVRTTTITNAIITDATVNSEGRAVVVGEDAPLYTRAPMGDRFDAQELEGRISLYSVLPEANGRFLVGGEQGVLFEGDPAIPSWTRIPIEHDLGLGLRVRALARPFDDAELWVAGSRGRILRRDPERRWDHTELVMPRGFQGCVRGDRPPCGGLAQLNSVDDLIVLPRGGSVAPAVFMLLAQCSAVIQVTRDTRCPGVMPFGELPIEGLEKTRFSSMDVLASRWLTVGNEDASSMIYELDIQAARAQ